MGQVVLRFLETPGHTPESVSVVVTDLAKSPEPQAVLTGDTLFIGDVGRPDLLGAKISPDALAGQLYDSLHEKLLKLPDSVAVYPAHGAGSLCGRNISSEKSSTIGQQRQFNYALRPMSRPEFIALVTADLPEAPEYFSRDARLNREGPGSLAALPAPAALSPDEVERRVAAGALLLDARTAAEHGNGHVPGSLQIGLGGQFASWAGSLVPPDASIVLVLEDEAAIAEVQTRLARVGLENVVGYLAGGIRAWDASGRTLARTEQIGVDELAARIGEGSDLAVVDVRRPGEWQTGHIAQAVSLPLHELDVARRGARPRAARRRDVRGRLPLGDRHERAGAARFSEDHERRRRHGGVERGEARSQHAVVGRRFDAELGTRVVDGGCRRGVAGIGGPRAGREARRQRLGFEEVGLGAVEARPEGRGLPLRRRLQELPQRLAQRADVDARGPAAGEGRRLRGVHRRRPGQVRRPAHRERPRPRGHPRRRRVRTDRRGLARYRDAPRQPAHRSEGAADLFRRTDSRSSRRSTTAASRSTSGPTAPSRSSGASTRWTASAWTSRSG